MYFLFLNRQFSDIVACTGALCLAAFQVVFISEQNVGLGIEFELVVVC